MEEQLKKQFDLYIRKFDINDPKILMKYSHSLRVMKLALLIAKHSNFNEDDYKIIEVIGLLHDYGRFLQWEKYHTYKDYESVDHADLGIKLLFKENQIQNFWSKEEDYDEICNAIKYHNKYKIPDDLSEYSKSLCKIIRDADKLDNFYLLGKDSTNIQETDDSITPKLKSDFEKKQLLDKTDITNPNDIILIHLAYLFDLNYEYSFQYLYDNKMIEKYFNLIKDKEKFKPYFEMINSHIKERVKKNVR